MRSTSTRRRFLVPILLPCVLAILAFGRWTGELARGEDALIQRQYGLAVGHLRAAVAELEGADRQRAKLLLGQALALSGDGRGAVAAYRELIDELPPGPMRSRTRFRLADRLSADRTFADAATIYHDEVAGLIGVERKEQIARTYLDLADRALAKPKVDHARAVTFFDLAVGLELSPAKTATVQLAAAEAQLAAAQWADAARRFEQLLPTRKLGTGRVRVLLGLGRARLGTKDRIGARRSLRELLRIAPDHERAADAAWELARSHGVPKPSAGDLPRAVVALERLAANYPEHDKARVARYLIAKCYQHVGRSEQCLEAYRAYVASAAAQPADHGAPQLAMARAAIGDVLRGQGQHEAAMTAWREYLAKHPSAGDWERVQRAIPDAEYALASLAYDRGTKGFDEARTRYREFARRYPLDRRNAQLQFRLAQMLAIEDRHQEAIAAFGRCASKFPNREEASHARYRIGEIQEQKLHDFPAAIAAYRAVTGKWSGRAKQQLGILERPELGLFTPRTYRSNEAPVVQVTSRNIESVRVRVWRLDLETYFRATHMAAGVDRLDIEIIEPDATFDSKVEDYTEFRRTERAVDLSSVVKGQVGAYVLKMDDGEREATGMVLVSDVALIAKSSRHELFVFTQHLIEDRAEPGMRVVVSDGRRMVAEGVTDARGVYRFKGKELKSLDRLSVFAVGAGGSGAGSLGLSGLGYQKGLVAKGFLWTDRPVCRPGEEVHLQGIVREVENGQYRIPAASEGDPYRVQVNSPSGRMLLRRSVQFSPFGTFGLALSVPATAELGTWSVEVRRGGTVHSTRFEVARYQRPKVSIAIDMKRSVVFRGEAIEGVLRVRHFFGAPAVGRVVQYQLVRTGGRVDTRTGTTDAAGEVRFSWPTEDLPEEAIVAVRCSIAEDGVNAMATAQVVTTEVAATVRTMRPLYVSGEPFEAEITLRNRAGEPLARPAKVTLLRQVAGRRGTQEVVVQTVEVAATDAKTGQARVALTAAKGGVHLVRVSTVDRFDHVVTATTRVEISGDDDRQKLRLLTERERYRVGDAVTVRVVNRAGPRLALETVQGDGVISFRTRQIPAGESTFELELAEQHAPNFALALAMIDGNVLRLAQRELEVTRDLRVTIQTPEEVRPGASVEAKLVVQDARGRPVAAEFALAAVDAAVLSVYPERFSSIGSMFWGARRVTAFRTTSSCGWQHRGQTRTIGAAMRSEQQRVARAELLERMKSEQAGGRAVRSLQSRTKAGLGAVTQDEVLRVEPPRSGGGGGGSRSGADDFFMGGTVRNPLGQVADSPGHNARAYAKRVQMGRYFNDGRGDAGRAETVRRDFGGFGAWRERIVTGADGTATVELKLPDTLTEWRLVAHGVTVESSVGVGRAVVHARKPLQVELSAPSFLVEGDEVSASVQVHNTTDRKVEVELATEVDGARTVVPRAELGPAGETQRDLTLKAGLDRRQLPVRLAVRATDGTSDAVERVLEVARYGAELRDGATGSVRDQTAFELALRRPVAIPQMELWVSTGSVRALAGAVLDGHRMPPRCGPIASTNSGLASRGLAAGVLLAATRGEGKEVLSVRSRLRSVIDSVLTRLVVAQNRDGSYPWIRPGGSANLAVSCQVARFLATANKLGFGSAATPLRDVREYLLRRVRELRDADRVLVVHALAALDAASFESLTTLHRARANYDLHALGRLMRAWQAEGRKTMAGELVALVRSALQKAVGAKGSNRSAGGRVAAVAIAVEALLRQSGDDAVAREGLEWLEQRRVGPAWATPEATAAAIGALCSAPTQTASGSAGMRGSVAITVNDHELAAVDFAERGDRVAFAVPREHLRASGKYRVRLKVSGNLTVHYGATLSGFTNTLDKAVRGSSFGSVRRAYEPALRRVNGEAIRPGFRAVEGRYRSFTNQVDRARVGDTLRASVSYSLNSRHRASAPPMIVEDPLPSGCALVRSSLSGNYEHVEITPSKLVFYFADRVTSGSARYELQARFAGKFRTPPAMIYSARFPERVAYGGERALEIAGREVEMPKYRMTPDELLALGKAAFDAGKLDECGELLDRLLGGWHHPEKGSVRLRRDRLADVSRMMLAVSIHRRHAAGIVRFFEELEDLSPNLAIPFRQMLAVGRAYRGLGEFERALIVFRGMAEASFLKEAAVAKTLQSMKEVEAAMDFLQQLTSLYPDLATIRMSRYGIGQRLAALAARTDHEPAEVARLRSEAVQELRAFLVDYPQDPLAEEVSFAWATTHVEGEQLKEALEVAERALARYPESNFVDELLYTKGYVEFALGQHEAAFETLQRVATEEFVRPDSGGAKGPSENRDHAIYLQGQIHHARGEAAEALAKYGRVKDKFSDADEASDYFLRKRLVLPEITVAKSGAKAALPLTFRNVERASVRVYRVDLMRLYLLEKSLNRIRNVELHGIRPHVEVDVELGDGRDYRDREHRLPLELAEAGAYLVVARAGDLLATGMVLRSDLKIEVQEAADVGRIRVNVTRSGACLPSGHCKVVGSGDQEVRSGDTDLRGVFTADGLVGKATVIAKFGDEYAFYRGGEVHQPAKFRPAQDGPAGSRREYKKRAGQTFDAWGNNLEYNTRNRARQMRWLDQQVLDKKQKGVEVYRAK